MALQFMDFAGVQPQVETLQLTKNPSLNLQKTPDTSFSDLVASFQTKEKAPEAGVQNNMNEKPVLSEEKPENVSAASEAEKENPKVSENVQQEESSEKEEKVIVKDFAESSEKTEKKLSVKDEKESQLQKKSETKTKNLVKKPSDEDKIQKDLHTSRIDELLQNADDFSQFVNNFENQEIKNQVSLKNDEDFEIPQADFLNTEGQISQSQLEYLNSPVTEEDLKFNFEDDFQSKKNLSKFDKEGKITVEDLRTKSEKVDFEALVKDAKDEKSLKTELKFTGENTATITMEYAQTDAQADILSLNNQSAGAQNSNFQQMLNNQIQANVPEFVKAGNIVLKDNNQGTINLVLHPDDLGNVKIQLSLDGKTVQGHIAVATKEAMQVFKDNAETLREAFIKSGFENASFDVSYSGGQNGQFGNGEQFAQNDGNDLWGKRTYSTGGVEVFGDAESAEDFVNFESNFGKNSVNIVA
ncbi:flagellar hook-length control protein FliK [Treponema sp. C6A8]|uniref:flagellar hook-length control protein FliK n=1 Tax=Treponema sp. C6A8 TaxID=1410609 RepID=UPI000AC25FA1|nr:flagellar hook-length control protein FliK [Treponema sp. C6A8]